MKNVLIVLLASAFLFGSCKKEGCTDSTALNFNEKAKKDDGSCTYATSVADGFVWKEDNGGEIKADSAFWTTGTWGTGIRAFKGGIENFFEINWDNQNNTSVGTKNLSSSYGFTFLKNSTTYTNSGSSTVTISSFANDKLSGNFTISVSGGSIQSIKSTFANLPKK